MTSSQVAGICTHLFAITCLYWSFVLLVCLFLADRTNGRAIATLRLSSVCNVMYCG